MVGTPKAWRPSLSDGGPIPPWPCPRTEGEAGGTGMQRRARVLEGMGAPKASQRRCPRAPRLPPVPHVPHSASLLSQVIPPAVRPGQGVRPACEPRGLRRGLLAPRLPPGSLTAPWEARGCPEPCDHRPGGHGPQGGCCPDAQAGRWAGEAEMPTRPPTLAAGSRDPGWSMEPSPSLRGPRKATERAWVFNSFY